MSKPEKICQICRNAPAPNKADACDACLKGLLKDQETGSPSVWRRTIKGKAPTLTNELLSVLSYHKNNPGPDYVTIPKLAYYLKITVRHLQALLRNKDVVGKITTSGLKVKLKDKTDESMSVSKMVSHIIDAVPLRAAIERLLDATNHG